MSEQLKEKVRVSTPHLPDQEEISRGLDVPDVNARLRRWKHRRRTTKEVLVFMLPMALMAVLLIAGIIFSQITPAATPSTASTSTNTAPTVAVPPHPTYNALAPTTPQGSTVNLTLTVKEVLISIAPDVAYHAWTFNGTVPGPVLRVRQGQVVHFTLINEGTMPHSIDFHAAQTPWNVNYQEIAPGKSFSFNWRANYPGVFMYHCGSPTVIYHMANGMYGTIIVDPANGWAPAREYVLVQSEFYAAKQPDGSYFVDPQKLATGIPDYVVFNGYANQYKADPLTARAGQRIRLFIVNAGPTLFSAFHVIGAIFSDTYVDGNPANHMVGNQTVTIPPGGGVVVELTIPQAGLYPFVTHSFASVDKGAIGVLKVTP
jgi:nitrite reductase (NO-forming)